MSKSSPRRLIKSALAAVALSFSLTACIFVPASSLNSDSNNPPVDTTETSVQQESSQDSLPTAACLEAAKTADEDQNQLYATHPFFADEDLDLASPEGQAAFEDSEKQWDAILEPLYFACEGPADFWEAMHTYPLVAGVTSPEFLDTFVIEAWCYNRTDNPPMCEGWEEFVSGGN